MVGYAFLREHLSLPIPPVLRPAMVQPVARVVAVSDSVLGVPSSVAPDGDDVLMHVLFALKHEGTDLLVLNHALRHVPAQRVLDERLSVTRWMPTRPLLLRPCCVKRVRPDYWMRTTLSLCRTRRSPIRWSMPSNFVLNRTGCAAQRGALLG